MEYPIHPYGWNEKASASSNKCFATNNTDWPLIIARLLSEKGILEDGLARSVTYGWTLGKKQARNERRLQSEPLVTRKKRKKIRQNNYKLKSDIKNYEQDEQAYLTNLRVCETNLHMAQLLFRSSMNLYSGSCMYPPTSRLYPSQNYNCHPICGSGPPSQSEERSWHDWYYTVSPISTDNNQAFLDRKVNIDDLFNGSYFLSFGDKDFKASASLAYGSEYDDAALPVPPNTRKPSSASLSSASEAATCEFLGPNKGHDITSLGLEFDEVSLALPLTINKPEDSREWVLIGIVAHDSLRRFSV